MESIDIYESKALGTNVLHYRLLETLQRMAALLQREPAEIRRFKEQSEALKAASTVDCGTNGTKSTARFYTLCSTARWTTSPKAWAKHWR
jgi:hypothetical protein